MNHNFPMGLDESVGRLTAGGAQSDTGTVEMEKQMDVTLELMGQVPCFGTERQEGHNNVVVV